MRIHVKDKELVIYWGAGFAMLVSDPEPEKYPRTSAVRFDGIHRLPEALWRLFSDYRDGVYLQSWKDF